MKERKIKKCLDYSDEQFLPSLHEQAQYILNNFDFQYVSEVMATSIRKDIYGNKHPWKITMRYASEPVIPSEMQLRMMALDMMIPAINTSEKVYITRSGPFRLIKVHNRLILDFVLKTESYD